MRLLPSAQRGETAGTDWPLSPERQVTAYLQEQAPARGRLLLAVASAGHALEWAARAACLYLVEPDPCGLTACQRRLGRCPCPNVRVLGSSATRLPLPPSLVDLVFARLDLLLARKDGADAVREALRVLKPGGSFYGLDTPPPGSDIPGPAAAQQQLADVRARLMALHGFQPVLKAPGAPAPLQAVLDALPGAGDLRLVMGVGEPPVPLSTVAILYHRRK